ncbi:MAG: Ig-like domain-containing protein [Bacteroidetes bacterium]|nr:Ig-like domain-containing protein [Bacteroidota bacterium]
MTNTIRLLLLLLVALVQYRCANETAPTGGKEDSEPPKVKKMVPENYSTSFSADEINITFNEFIQDNGFAQTLISPATDPAPIFRVNGRTLNIKLKAELQPNTTYTINFGSNLKDLNQGNEYKNFKYVFSTGSYIDSAKVIGRVKNVENDKELENLYVNLYQSSTNNPVQNMKPTYFSKTDKLGNFSIENIKAGSYQMFALKDQNLNFIYDLPNELVGFSDTSILANDTIPKNIDLVVFKESPKRIKLQSVKSVEPGKIFVSYNAPVQTLKLDSKLFSDGFSSFIYPTKDTAIIWFSNYYSKYDSIYLVANDTLFDTLRIELKTIEKDSLLASTKNALRIANQSLISNEKVKAAALMSPYESLKIKMNRPIIGINDFKGAEIRVDSSAETTRVYPKINRENAQEILLDFSMKPDKQYTVVFPDSMLRDIFGVWNKEVSYAFNTAKEDAFGNIIIKAVVQDLSKHYLLQVLNAENKLVNEVPLYGEAEKKINIEKILAGVYHIRVLEDTNADATWNTGDLLLRKQPEKIIDMLGTHTLKGGWDLEIEVKL